MGVPTDAIHTRIGMKKRARACGGPTFSLSLGGKRTTAVRFLWRHSLPAGLSDCLSFTPRYYAFTTRMRRVS